MYDSKNVLEKPSEIVCAFEPLFSGTQIQNCLSQWQQKPESFASAFHSDPEPKNTYPMHICKSKENEKIKWLTKGKNRFLHAFDSHENWNGTRSLQNYCIKKSIQRLHTFKLKHSTNGKFRRIQMNCACHINNILLYIVILSQSVYSTSCTLHTVLCEIVGKSMYVAIAMQ